MTFSRRKQKLIQKKEGDLILACFESAQQKGCLLNKSEIMRELKMSRSLFNRWASGDARIRDEHLMLLGKLLGFDPFKIRPEMQTTKGIPVELVDVRMHVKLMNMSLAQRNFTHELVNLIDEYWPRGRH